MEKLWETQDKWALIAWGLKQKQCFLFRKQFLDSTNELKDKFRILLGRWLAKRAEKQFSDLTEMILTYDNNDPKPKRFAKTDIKKGKVNTDINNLNLDIV